MCFVCQIMGRKANPDASYLEIEKNFYKNKGKIVEVKEVPIDGYKKGQSSSSLDGLNLVRPVPKKGFKFEVDDKPIVSEIKKPSQTFRKPVDHIKRSVPNIILRKPTVVNEADVEDKPSKLRIKRNLSLTLKSEQAKEQFSDMTLLRKPEPMSVTEEHSGNADANVVGDMELKMGKEELKDSDSDFSLLKKPEPVAKLESGNAEFVESDGVNGFEKKDLEGSSDFSEAANAMPNSFGKFEDGSLIKGPTRKDESFYRYCFYCIV